MNPKKYITFFISLPSEYFKGFSGDHLNLDDVHFDEEPQFFGGGLENQVAW